MLLSEPWFRWFIWLLWITTIRLIKKIIVQTKCWDPIPIGWSVLQSRMSSRRRRELSDFKEDLILKIDTIAMRSLLRRDDRWKWELIFSHLSVEFPAITKIDYLAQLWLLDSSDDLESSDEFNSCCTVSAQRSKDYSMKSRTYGTDSFIKISTLPSSRVGIYIFISGNH